MARLVLVHGFTQTGASWAPIASVLAAQGHEVLTPDAPGHGGAAEIQADLWAGADLMATYGPAVYIGYSMGGRLALHVALAHPESVTKLVLIGASAGIEDDLERAARGQADEGLAAELEAGGVDGLEAWIDRWLAQPLFTDLPPEAAGRAERLRNTPSGLASSLRLAGTGAMTPLWDRLAELDMPVLVLAGEGDAKFAPLGARMVNAIGTNASLGLIAGAGHAAHLEQPEAVAAAIAAFVGDRR